MGVLTRGEVGGVECVGLGCNEMVGVGEGYRREERREWGTDGTGCGLSEGVQKTAIYANFTSQKLR